MIGMDYDDSLSGTLEKILFRLLSDDESNDAFKEEYLNETSPGSVEHFIVKGIIGNAKDNPKTAEGMAEAFRRLLGFIQAYSPSPEFGDGLNRLIGFETKRYPQFSPFSLGYHTSLFRGLESAFFSSGFWFKTPGSYFIRISLPLPSNFRAWDDISYESGSVKLSRSEAAPQGMNAASIYTVSPIIMQEDFIPAHREAVSLANAAFRKVYKGESSAFN